MASPSLPLRCERLPAVTTFPGLAEVELKFAPEPTAIIAASRRANRTPTIFWGEACQTAANRCMEETFHGGDASGRRLESGDPPAIDGLVAPPYGPGRMCELRGTR